LVTMVAELSSFSRSLTTRKIRSDCQFFRAVFMKPKPSHQVALLVILTLNRSKLRKQNKPKVIHFTCTS
jgi:hypothetical protein